MKSITFALGVVLGSGLVNGNVIRRDDATSADAAKYVPYSPYVMAQIDKLHAKGFTGKGTKVALIGTGVDYKHKAFGGCFGKGCVISGGYDFVGDKWEPGEVPQPKPEPLETYDDGIGTRGASMLAAQPNGAFLNFTGVAPGVEILAYKVTGYRIRQSPTVVASAIDRAVKDGADIIISFTEDFYLDTDKRPVMQAATRAIERGVAVMVGVDSQFGLPGDGGDYFSIDAITGAKGVEAAGKFETEIEPILLRRGSIKVSSEDKSQQSFLYQLQVSGPRVHPALDRPLYAIDGDGCSPLPDTVPDLAGRIVLVKAGGCQLYKKQDNLKPKNGNDYVIFYTADDGYLTRDDFVFAEFAAVVNAKTAENWQMLLKSGKEVTIHVDSPPESQKSLAVGKPTTYGAAVRTSHYGPSQSLEIKPIYGAPSALGVTARWNNDYEVAPWNGKGNAMVAGVYALIAQARGVKPTTENIQTLLANTAKAQLYHDGTKFVPGVLASVATQGAGLIQAYDAAYAKASVTPISVPFNDTDNALKEATLTLVNHNTIPVTYSLGTVGARTEYLIRDQTTNTDQVIKANLDTDKITVQPGKSATFKVTPPAKIDLPLADKLPIWSGYVTINGTDGTNLAVPYMGVQGSMYKVQPFTKKPLLWKGAHQFPSNGTITLGKNEDYYVDIHTYYTLGSPVVELYLQSIDDAGNPTPDINGLLPFGPYQAQTRKQITSAPLSRWNGTLVDGTQAPEGRYIVRGRALRVFGNPAKDEDWHVLNSNAFNIAYPE